VVLGDIALVKHYDKDRYKGPSSSPNRRGPKKPNSTDVFDSVMAEKKEYGGFLRHREYIVYDRGQVYPEYAVKYTRIPE